MRMKPLLTMQATRRWLRDKIKRDPDLETETRSRFAPQKLEQCIPKGIYTAVVIGQSYGRGNSTGIRYMKLRLKICADLFSQDQEGRTIYTYVTAHISHRFDLLGIRPFSEASSADQDLYMIGRTYRIRVRAYYTTAMYGYQNDAGILEWVQ